MADNQNAAFKITQITFQPFCHPDVKMIGRFVQNQEIRAFDESRCQ
ncbi:hypothetical protein SDC9_129508 [bioreactor metagenome]|uniref:Uncharacterized protein n=1 Tax=bioreactor metagenome TaxID=1076179 RepID=A0A645CZT7_9ZZZZ